LSSTATRPETRCCTCKAWPISRSISRRSDLGKDAGERFDLVEHAVDLALVAAESHAFREGVGEDEKALVRQILERDRAAGGDAVLALAADREDGDLILLAQAGAFDAILEFCKNVLFLERRQADHHRHAVAIERNASRLADVKRQRRGRNRIRPFEAAGFDAVAKQQRPRRHPHHRGKRLRFVHTSFLAQKCDNGLDFRARPGRFC
jgi:hypothetical protein